MNCQCHNILSIKYGVLSYRGYIVWKRHNVNHVQNFYLSTWIICLSHLLSSQKTGGKKKQEEWSQTTNSAGVWKITGIVKHSASHSFFLIYRRFSFLHLLRTTFSEHFYSFLFQRGKSVVSLPVTCTNLKEDFLVACSYMVWFLIGWYPSDCFLHSLQYLFLFLI